MADETLCPSHLFPSLRLGRYRFVAQPLKAVSLPSYQGSTWRGVIGNALGDVICPWDNKDCETCSNRNTCAYHYLYEAGLKEKGFANLPRPYIFCALDNKGTELLVDMTLIGDAGDFLPHLTAAWIRAGERGVGKGRGRFKLHKVYKILPDEKHVPVYENGCAAGYEETTFPLVDYLGGKAVPAPWKISITTPLRLRQNGKNIASVDWGKAFKSLAIRLSLMNQRYCGGTRPNKEAWHRLTTFLADPGASENHTKWFDWKRFSSTQHTHVPMGGIVGESLITPPGNIIAWRRWWETACLFHLGKGTSMGLGNISLG